MLNTSPAPCDAAQAVRLADIRLGREHWFPSEGSLLWHFRRFKGRYVRAGAVMVIRGAIFLDPARFDHEFNLIVREEAERLLGV